MVFVSNKYNLCRYLAACYYRLGPEFAAEKVFESMLDAATRIHPHLVMPAPAGAQSGFYRGLAELNYRFVKMEARADRGCVILRRSIVFPHESRCLAVAQELICVDPERHHR